MLSTFDAPPRNAGGTRQTMGTFSDARKLNSYTCFVIPKLISQGHLNDGYGLCIRHYTKLLIMKLEFHDRNPRIPGNLALKRGELEAMASNDINF